MSVASARTIQYRPHGGLDLIDIDPPAPGPGQVQIQGLACGICALDIHVYQHGAPNGCIPGHEGVGRVMEVGPGVQSFEPGQRVAGRGLGFAQRANVHASQLLHLPENHLPDEQWLVEPVSCVITGLDHCQLKAADRVAVVGCGFMGLLLVQGLARSMIDELVAIDLDDERLALATTFGAHETFNARAADFDDHAAALRQRGFDTVVDTTGSQAGLDLSSKLVRQGGRLNLFGWNHGRAEFPGDLWHMGGITVVNSAPNSQLRDPFPPAVRLIEKGLFDLEPLVTHVVELEAYPELLAKAAAREDGYIKGVVRLSDD
ncbi:MAG: zinc-binding dehydrogenase [Phycisphaeraceae bacterium]